MCGRGLAAFGQKEDPLSLKVLQSSYARTC